MAGASNQEPQRSLSEIVRAEKEKVHVLLVEEEGSQLDLIEIVRELREQSYISINGIVRVYDYAKQIADSSLLLFVACESEYYKLVEAKKIKLSGQIYRVKKLALISDIAIDCYESECLPINLLISGMFPVLRPLLSDYLVMEGERLKTKVPDFKKINGIILPFFERRQMSRNFAFLIVKDKKSSEELIVEAHLNWKDGREIRKAVSSIVVVHKDAEKTLKKYKAGKFSRLKMSKEVNDLNFLSANLWK
jgi:hypothetical protein